MTRRNVNISDETWRAVKVAAARDDKLVSAVVEEALLVVLADYSPEDAEVAVTAYQLESTSD